MAAQTITAAHRAERAARRGLIHSGEMDGLTLTPATRADADEYVAGTIDSAELVARVRARYGLT